MRTRSMVPGVSIFDNRLYNILRKTDVGLNTTYDEARSSRCSTCAVEQDLSIYWTPLLMFVYPNNTVVAVPQVDGMLM